MKQTGINKADHEHPTFANHEVNILQLASAQNGSSKALYCVSPCQDWCHCLSSAFRWVLVPDIQLNCFGKFFNCFLRYYNTNRAGNIISFDVWKQCYQAGTLRRIWIYQQIHKAVPGVWSTMEMLWRDMNLTGFRLAHARVWELLVEYFSLSATFPGQETGGLRLGWRATEATQSHSVSHPDMIPVSGAGGWSGMLSVTQRHREQPRPTISKPQLETRCSRVRECFFKSLMTFQSPESSAWQVSDLGFIAGYHGLATLRWAHNQVSQDESKVSIASNLRVSLARVYRLVGRLCKGSSAARKRWCENTSEKSSVCGAKFLRT